MRSNSRDAAVRPISSTSWATPRRRACRRGGSRRTDQADVPAAVVLLQEPQHPHGDLVLRGEHRGGRVGSPEHRGRGPPRRVHGVDVQGAEPLVAGQTRGRHRGPVAGQSRLCRGDVGAVPEKGDPAVPVAEQVLGREPRTALVVDQHPVGDLVVEFAVDQDQRIAPGGQGSEMRGPRADRRDDEAVDPAGEQVAHPCLLPLGVVVQARGEDRDPAVAAGVLDGPQDAAGEGVAEPVHQHAHRRAALVEPAEAAGRGVGPVAQFTATRWTRSRVAAATPGSSLTTRLTVFQLTPATAATCLSVGREPPRRTPPADPEVASTPHPGRAGRCRRRLRPARRAAAPGRWSSPATSGAPPRRSRPRPGRPGRR